MSTVRYTASEFGQHWGDKLKGSHEISVTWEEIVWAAITVGKPGVSYLLSHGWHSVSDLIVRSHTVYANLKENYTHFEKSSLYESLDPTEKSGISYFMGMIAAKILARRLLDTPWLFHVSMIHLLSKSVDLLGKSQPDLVGLRRNLEWIVVEAKGRTGRYSPSAMQIAKNQTQQLRRVNGQYPALRVGVQASFGPNMQWAIEDPEEYEQSARDVDFDVEGTLQMYYSSALAASGQGTFRRIAGRDFQVNELSDIGVTIGIDHQVRDYLVNSGSNVEGTLDTTREPLDQREVDDFVVFSDGIAISLDDRWSDERMRLEPQRRRNR